MDMARLMQSSGGEILAVHVVEPVSGFASYYLPDDHEEQVRKQTLSAMAERVGPAKDAELVILHGHPGVILSEYAKSIEADCIVVGSHKTELNRFLLGSTAARVVRHAHCAVHVLR